MDPPTVIPMQIDDFVERLKRPRLATYTESADESEVDLATDSQSKKVRASKSSNNLAAVANKAIVKATVPPKQKIKFN